MSLTPPLYPLSPSWVQDLGSVAHKLKFDQTSNANITEPRNSQIIREGIQKKMSLLVVFYY